MVLQWRRGGGGTVVLDGDDGEDRGWFLNGEEGEARRWFCNGDDGEERFPCLSVADRWAPLPVSNPADLG